MSTAYRLLMSKFLITWVLAMVLSLPASACAVDRAASVALRVIGGSVTVPVEVNGITGSFILDTGAERSVVSEEAVRRLGLARDPWVSTTMSGVGGVERRANAVPRSLSLGGVSLVRRTVSHDTSLTVAPLLRGRSGGATIDGLLGRDYLSLFDLDADFAGKRLTMYRVQDCGGRFLPWTGPYTGEAVASPASNALIIPVVLDGTPLRALLDTGATASLLAAPGMYRMRLDVAGLSQDPSEPVSGLGPRVPVMHRHLFRSLVAVGQAITPPEIWVAPVRLAPTADMLLGLDWLRGRRVWISYATRQIFVATP